MIGALVALWYVAPEVTVLLALPCVYLAAFGAVLADATVVATVRDAAVGNPVSLRQGWAVAWAHRRTLAAWAFTLLTVGFAIRAASAALGRLGELFGFAAEVAWATIALVVVPAIVVGNSRTWEAIDNSRESLRSTLGQRVRGMLGISATGLLLVAPFAAFLLIAAVIDSGPLIVAGLVAWAAAWTVTMFLLDAASAVLGYAIYANLENTPLPASFGDTAFGAQPPAPAAS